MNDVLGAVIYFIGGTLLLMVIGLGLISSVLCAIRALYFDGKEIKKLQEEVESVRNYAGFVDRACDSVRLRVHSLSGDVEKLKKGKRK